MGVNNAVKSLNVSSAFITQQLLSLTMRFEAITKLVIASNLKLHLSDNSVCQRILRELLVELPKVCLDVISILVINYYNTVDVYDYKM